MISAHPVRHTFFFGALAVSLATLAIEISAQSQPKPEHALSNAISEVLRSPFHGDRGFPGTHGRPLPLAAAVPPPAASSHAGLAASRALHAPNPQAPSPDHAPSRAKMFLLTTLASAVGLGGTVLWAEQCSDVVPVDLGRAPAGAGSLSLCPGEGVVFITGYLATITMTGGAATLAGSGFRRSLTGSVLGFGGAVLTAVGIAGLNPDLPGELLFGFPIVHAAITTLVAG